MESPGEVGAFEALLMLVQLSIRFSNGKDAKNDRLRWGAVPPELSLAAVGLGGELVPAGCGVLEVGKVVVGMGMDGEGGMTGSRPGLGGVLVGGTSIPLRKLGPDSSTSSVVERSTQFAAV